MNAGIFLHATALLNDTFFEDAIIFITEYNEKGAMGFVINRVFPRGLTELEEFKHGKSFPLRDGGPVDKEHLYFLHRRPDLIAGGTLVADGIYFGGDFKAAVEGINNSTLTEQELRIFIGYCGWDNGELEEEVAEGSWEVAASGTVF
jgi:putative transcriptional regulator